MENYRATTPGIASHLTGCDECRRLFEELRLISTMIRAQLATRHTPPLALLAKVMAAIADLPLTRLAQRGALHRRLIWRRLRRVRP